MGKTGEFSCKIDVNSPDFLANGKTVLYNRKI